MTMLRLVFLSFWISAFVCLYPSGCRRIEELKFPVEPLFFLGLGLIAPIFWVPVAMEPSSNERGLARSCETQRPNLT